MARALLFLIFLFLPSPLWAQGDAVSTALDIVENFHKEANILMGAAGLSEVPPAEKERAVSELREIRVTEVPGRMRLERVHGVVDTYTSSVLGMVESRLGEAQGAKKGHMRDGLKRLADLRLDETIRLMRTIDIEEPSPEVRPDLPFTFDPTPPYERPSPPDGPPGILYR